MSEFSRYAVYAAPRPGPFAEFAASWLGWDPERGAPVVHPDVGALPVEDITATPRKYGFHGTLKPPFRLAEGSSRTALETDLAALAERLAPVQIDRLALHALGGFLALIPEGDTAKLGALAAETVRALDHHRAPAPPAELARRRAGGLTAAQHANLDAWGYPYVMDEFRFHFTLTGRLDDAMAEHAQAALADLLPPVLPKPFILADLCLFGEDSAGMFHLLHRYALTG